MPILAAARAALLTMGALVLAPAPAVAAERSAVADGARAEIAAFNAAADRVGKRPHACAGRNGARIVTLHRRVAEAGRAAGAMNAFVRQKAATARC